MKRHVQRVFLFILLSSFFLATVSAEDAFWRFTRDRYNKPALADRLDVPAGVDPYAYLAESQGFDDWMTRDSGGVTYLAEKAVDGVVPILCLHKISREEDYALSPERFRRLLRYINDNGWYLISDFQYLQGDFSRVPSGLKPIVMGSDDASHGNLIYQTRGDLLTGPVKRFFGKPLLERDSMVAILEKYAAREEGRINFTFYISFDAVPFRQLDGAENPGFPYPDIPIVYEKVHYLDENFILGIHSLSHIYAHDMGPRAFAEDVMAAWEQIDTYAGGKAESLRTMAFPYGIRPLTPELRREVTALSRNGEHLAGAFDFDNKLAPPPGSPGDLFDVSRFNVDNKHWERLLRTLDAAEAVTARREVIWETASKRIPRSRYSLGAAPNDNIWVLVRDSDTDSATPVATNKGEEPAG